MKAIIIIDDDGYTHCLAYNQATMKGLLGEIIDIGEGDETSKSLLDQAGITPEEIENHLRRIYRRIGKGYPLDIVEVEETYDGHYAEGKYGL